MAGHVERQRTHREVQRVAPDTADEVGHGGNRRRTPDNDASSRSAAERRRRPVGAVTSTRRRISVLPKRFFKKNPSSA
jgi:hypothetical protein